MANMNHQNHDKMDMQEGEKPMTLQGRMVIEILRRSRLRIRSQAGVRVLSEPRQVGRGVGCALRCERSSGGDE
jgi:hypothetical protein